MWNVDPYLQTQWQLIENCRWMLACATAPYGLIPTIITLLRVTAMTVVMPVITNGYQPDR